MTRDKILCNLGTWENDITQYLDHTKFIRITGYKNDYNNNDIGIFIFKNINNDIIDSNKELFFYQNFISKSRSEYNIINQYSYNPLKAIIYNIDNKIFHFLNFTKINTGDNINYFTSNKYSKYIFDNSDQLFDKDIFYHPNYIQAGNDMLSYYKYDDLSNNLTKITRDILL